MSPTSDRKSIRCVAGCMNLSEDLLTYLRSLLQECIANLHFTVWVRGCIECTTLEDSHGLVEAINLDLAVCCAHGVVHLVVLTIRVDVLDRLQFAVQFPLLGPARLLSVGLVGFSFTHSLFCGLLLAVQLFHLLVGIFFEIVELRLGSILICFGICPVFHNVVVNHFHNGNDALGLASLASIGISESCWWRWRCSAGLHAFDWLLLNQSEAVVFVEALQHTLGVCDRLCRSFVIRIGCLPCRVLICAHVAGLLEGLLCGFVIRLELFNVLLALGNI